MEKSAGNIEVLFRHELKQGPVGGFADVLAGVVGVSPGDVEAGEGGGDSIEVHGYVMVGPAGDGGEFDGFSGESLDAEGVAGGQAHGEDRLGANLRQQFEQSLPRAVVIHGQTVRDDLGREGFRGPLGGDPAWVNEEMDEGFETGQEESRRGGWGRIEGHRC